MGGEPFTPEQASASPGGLVTDHCCVPPPIASESVGLGGAQALLFLPNPQALQMLVMRRGLRTSGLSHTAARTSLTAGHLGMPSCSPRPKTELKSKTKTRKGGGGGRAENF